MAETGCRTWPTVETDISRWSVSVCVVCVRRPMPCSTNLSNQPQPTAFGGTLVQRSIAEVRTGVSRRGGPDFPEGCWSLGSSGRGVPLRGISRLRGVRGDRDRRMRLGASVAMIAVDGWRCGGGREAAPGLYTAAGGDWWRRGASRCGRIPAPRPRPRPAPLGCCAPSVIFGGRAWGRWPAGNATMWDSTKPSPPSNRTRAARSEAQMTSAVHLTWCGRRSVPRWPPGTSLSTLRWTCQSLLASRARPRHKQPIRRRGPLPASRPPLGHMSDSAQHTMHGTIRARGLIPCGRCRAVFFSSP